MSSSALTRGCLSSRGFYIPRNNIPRNLVSGNRATVESAGAAQLGERRVQLSELSFRQHRADTNLQFVFEGSGCPGEQSSSTRSELYQRRPAVLRVGQPTAMTRRLDAIDQLAGASDGDGQFRGDIEDPARRDPGNDLHGLEVGQR